MSLFRSLIACFLGFILAIFLWISPGWAQPSTALPTVTFTDPTTGQGAAIPNWSQISFGSMPGASQPGMVDVPPDQAQEFGYNPSRSWEAGETPDQYLMLGDLAQSFAPQLLNLSQISAITGIALDSVPLSELALLQGQTLASLVAAVPELANYPAGQIEPIRDLLLQINGLSLGEYQSAVPQSNGWWRDLLMPKAVAALPGQATVGAIDQVLKSPLGDLVKDVKVGGIALGELNLSQYNLTSIPGLADTALNKFGGWAQNFLRQIPGLSQIPLDKFPYNPLTMAGAVARIDMVYGAAENGIDAVEGGAYKQIRSVSGGDRAGKGGKTAFDIPCNQASCAYIELQDLTGTNPLVKGARWFKGGPDPARGEQAVKGGSGLAGAAASLFGKGMEPTGRMPFGETMKLVLINTDEASGTAEFGFYFRACEKGLFGGITGCTPFNIGPVPWLRLNEGDLVYLGPLDSVGSAPPPKVNIPPEMQGQIDQYGSGEGGDFSNNACVQEVLKKVPPGELQSASKFVPYLMQAAYKRGMRDPGQIAYLLATSSWESNMGSAMLEKGVGCGHYGDGCYQGRGFIQLTGVDNYRDMSQRLGIDLVSNPGRAEDPKVAADIAVVYLQSRGIGGYINGSQQNFYDVRSIVNGDKHYSSSRLAPGVNVGQGIAGWASQYHAAIKNCKASDLKDPFGGAAGDPVGAKVHQAAKKRIGMVTRHVPGTNGGRVACAWAVNRVLQDAGYKPLGANPNWVPDMVQDLDAGRGTRIDPNQGRPGDIVIQDGMNYSAGQAHVGICLNNGCTQVVSNSSTQGSFTWISDRDFSAAYPGTKSTVYRLKK